LMVRQSAPTPQGLPIAISAFTTTTNWGEYGNIQSDIFDHILAVLPAVSLCAHEAPTGSDLCQLIK
ncbi:miniconductance mechanosensitive channel, partial [Pseudoalteromonas sp. SIMBA_153]